MLNRRFSRVKINIKWKAVTKVLTAFILSVGIILGGGLLVVKGSVDYSYIPQIETELNELPDTRVAIVFGAGLENNGNDPSPILEDRVLAAVELYKAGKVDKLLMTGDNRIIEHNEPKIMMETAIENGVKEFDIQPDYAGRRTYDSCYRAKAIFGINKAILVTQAFHLPRAMYLCSSLGIEVYGYAADKHQYVSISSYTVREYLATFLAFWELNVFAPEVVLGDKITI